VPVAARHRSAATERQIMVAARVNGSGVCSAYCLRRKHRNSQRPCNREGEDTRGHRVIGLADVSRNALAQGAVIAILRVSSLRSITETSAILACLVSQAERPRQRDSVRCVAFLVASMF
jgi:hypothetical protein